MNLINLSYEALHRYFTRLTQFGYMKYSDVYDLLVLLYVQEIADNYDLSVGEQSIVDKALACLQGNSCMIPYVSCNGTCI